MINAANAKSIKAKNRRERRAAERHLADIRWVMSAPEGRRFVWSLLTSINETSFDVNPQLSALKEGIRNKELKIQAEVLYSCPELYLLAQKEAMNQQSLESAQDKALELESETPEKDEADD